MHRDLWARRLDLAFGTPSNALQAPESPEDNRVKSCRLAPTGLLRCSEIPAGVLVPIVAAIARESDQAKPSEQGDECLFKTDTTLILHFVSCSEAVIM